ncbi:MAG: response regulator [Cyclobacteriaceae bacterium]
MQNEVILIEDSSSDAELTIRVLRKKNIVKDVLWLKDGEEAIAYLQQGDLLADNPKLILLDLKLPKVDGISVLQEIKAHEEAKLVPVVILTSSDQEVDKISGYMSGANSYVVKPVEYEEFQAAIEEVGRYWLQRNTSRE